MDDPQLTAFGGPVSDSSEARSTRPIEEQYAGTLLPTPRLIDITRLCDARAM